MHRVAYLQMLNTHSIAYLQMLNAQGSVLTNAKYTQFIIFHIIFFPILAGTDSHRSMPGINNVVVNFVSYFCQIRLLEK